MDNDKTLARIYEHLDDDDVEKAVIACLRLARGTKDYLNIATFLHELYPNDQEFRRVLYEEVTSLNVLRGTMIRRSGVPQLWN